MITRPCEQCDEPVTRVPSRMQADHIYCSVDCKAAAQRARVTEPCDHCGEPVRRTPSRMAAYESTYCSPECRAADTRNQVTKPCDACGNPVTRCPSHMKGRVFCDKSCWRKNARRKSDDQISTRRMVYAPDHPVSGRGDYALESRKLLYDEIGPGPHPCHWCGDEVRWRPGEGPVSGALVVDHVDNDPANNALDNLVPSCQPCNGQRHSSVALAPGEHYIERGGRRLRTQEQECPACEEAFRAIPSDNQTYCSRECYYESM